MGKRINGETENNAEMKMTAEAKRNSIEEMAAWRNEKWRRRRRRIIRRKLAYQNGNMSK
jgi:hypothetical protein